MSTPGPTPTPPTPVPPTGTPPGVPQAATTLRPGEIKLIGRSMLFYWWPVWVAAFICATWTLIEDNRLAVLPSGGEMTVTETVKDEKGNEHPKAFTYTLKDDKAKSLRYDDQPVRDAVERSKDAKNPAWPTRVSRHPAVGVAFVLTLLMVVFTTNVPLRGLWSFVVLLMVALVIVILSLINGAWDVIGRTLSSWLVYINLATYLVIGGVVFVLWAVAFFIFDRRQFVIFSPGQIRVCEHIGDAVEAYSTVGVQMTKQRDDPFRHLLLGFGSSDLILKFASGDKREVRIQNVLGLNFSMAEVESMIRTVPN
jgi:hypothetical protein